MPNYKNGKIYKLFSPSNPDLGEYIGSTTQSLKKRMGEHKRDFKRYNEEKKYRYCSSYIILECGDAVIELVLKYECETRKELERKEGEYIKDNGCCANIVIAGRTLKEYREDNEEKIREHKKKYYQDNIDKIREYKKKYREVNKEKIKEYNKEYREDNKEKIREHKKEKIKCECGSIISRDSLSRHRKTKKHHKLLKEL